MGTGSRRVRGWLEDQEGDGVHGALEFMGITVNTNIRRVKGGQIRRYTGKRRDGGTSSETGDEESRAD